MRMRRRMSCLLVVVGVGVVEIWGWTDGEARGICEGL